MPTIEVTKSCRSACELCQETIKRGELRWGCGYGHSSQISMWYHIACFASQHSAGKRLDPEERSDITGWGKLNKHQTSKIIKLLWPNEVSDCQKLRLKLPKEINKMTNGELKLELQKRGRKSWGKKNEY